MSHSLKAPPKIILDGPPETIRYCPWWVPAFWTTREYPAHKIWELWDCEYYPGLGRVITEMASALGEAESRAREQIELSQTNQDG